MATTPGAEVIVQPLDLGSLESIRAAAEELRAVHGRIDLLVNNAGLMHPARGTTTDGFELHVGTNHLGHFALTGLLLDRLLQVPGSRIVTLTSIAHRVSAADIHFEDLHGEQRYSAGTAYPQSKLRGDGQWSPGCRRGAPPASHRQEPVRPGRGDLAEALASNPMPDPEAWRADLAAADETFGPDELSDPFAREVG